MANKNQKNKETKVSIQESIVLLFKYAQESSLTNPSRTKRYVKMVWELVKKYKIRLTKEQKTKFCRKCLAFFVPNKNVVVVFDSKHNLFSSICGNCGYKRVF